MMPDKLYTTDHRYMLYESQQALGYGLRSFEHVVARKTSREMENNGRPPQTDALDHCQEARARGNITSRIQEAENTGRTAERVCSFGKVVVVQQQTAVYRSGVT